MNDHMKKPDVIAAMVCAVAVFLPWLGEWSGLDIAGESSLGAAKNLMYISILAGAATGALAYMEKVKEMDIAKLVAGASSLLAFLWVMNEKAEGADLKLGAYIAAAAGAAVIGIFAKAKMDEKNNG